jgi:predicted nucleic acid-binding protein
MQYLDSCVVIDAVAPTDEGVLLREQLASSSMAFATSPLVRMESCVRPLRLNDKSTLAARLDLIDGCRMLTIDNTCFELAAHIRAAHAFATPDAIHLATASLGGCDRFLTDDQRILDALPGFAVDPRAAD